MAAQTNYNYGTSKGVAGGKFDLAFDEVVTRTNEAEDGVLKFGMAVAVGSAPGHNVTVVGEGTTTVEGVALCHANTEQDMNGNVVVKKNASLGIIRKGNVWGRLATGITPTYGAKAYVVKTGADAGTFTTASSGTLDIGATFGNVADEGIAVIVLK